MTDPYVIAVIAMCSVTLICFMAHMWKYSSFLYALVVISFLVSISFTAGWPTNSNVPSKFFVQGLTSQHIWAIEEGSEVPRSYYFVAPSQWYEEMNRTGGEGFWVEEIEAAGPNETGENEEDGGEGLISSLMSKKREWAISPPKEEKKADDS